ncbi:MAG: radical SAM protein [Treponema sp.]|jgi:putative pyruvate formate lyase activating enzyme|nr:radical SAM protein [Treponema sp.]
MQNHYISCKLCPRNCGINRLARETGFCGETAVLRVGAALKHYGEEPPLVGTGGSGTIFVSGCNLGCAFCQNYQISQHEGQSSVPTPALGKPVSPDEFAQICTALRDKGAFNINIVTGSHAIPALVEGFAACKKSNNCHLPILWNSSGYESVEALELLQDYVDTYLPDLKTLDPEIAARYFNAPDYPKTAAAAILKMIDTKSGSAKSMEKVIIRHLILPGHLDSTRSVLQWFAENVSGRAQLSLMTQYTPIPNRQRSMPQDYVTKEDYETVMRWLREFEIEDGFCQELVTGNEWLPDFKRPNPFSSELSVPVWHFAD